MVDLPRLIPFLSHRVTLLMAALLGGGACPALAQGAPPLSPLEVKSENGARAQALIIRLRDHLVPPRHRLGVGLEVQAMTLFHGPVPGALRERTWAKSLRAFSGSWGWELDELTWDSASPGSTERKSRYRGFYADRESKLDVREHVEDSLVQYAVFPEALVRLLEVHGAVREVLELGDQTGILVEIPGAEVLLRTVELDYGDESVPGLVGVDWLVHDELLGDVVGSLDYDKGGGPFPGVAAGFTVTGPMGEWTKVKAVSVEEDTGGDRFTAPAMRSTESSGGMSDIVIEWETLGKDLFEARIPQHDARVLALALPEGWAVMEAPVSTDVGRALLQTLKEERPDLRVAYVLASHHHPHYVGAMRPFLAEGAAIVCPEGVTPYIEELLYRPRTLFPDRLAREIRTERQPEPRIIGVPRGDRWSPDGIGDRLVAVEAAGLSQHTDDFMLFFLPQHKLAFGGDLLWLPVNGRRSLPSPRTQGLAAILKGSGLLVEEFLTSWPVKAAPGEPVSWRDRALVREIHDEADR